MSDEREEELAYLVHSHLKEDVGDGGRSLCTWVLLRLEDIMCALQDAELAVLDDYQRQNPSQHWGRCRRWLQRQRGACDAEAE